MLCRDVTETIGRYLDHELNDQLSNEMAEHLEVCPACRSEVDRLKNLADLFAACPVGKSPVSLTQSIITAAYRRRASSEGSLFDILADLASWFNTSARPLRWAAASTLTLGILMGTLLGSRLIAPSPDLPASNHTTLVESYSLDYLSGSPSGSLPDAYLVLADGADMGGN